MPNPTQREFPLHTQYGQHDQLRGPVKVTIIEAMEKEERLRTSFLSERMRGYEVFLKNGAILEHLHSSILKDFWGFSGDWLNRAGHYYSSWLVSKKYVDDKRNRFEWIGSFAAEDIAREEIRLTLAACNARDDNGRPLFNFRNGHLVDSLLPPWFDDNDIRRGIHVKVLEMNPAWSGEIERIIESLRKTLNLSGRMGNFTDLAVKPGFAESKPYLRTLMAELNRDVFQNRGTIEENVRLKNLVPSAVGPFSYLRIANPRPANIVLNCESAPSARPIGRLGRLRPNTSFIALMEHGSSEILIIAQRDKFKYWVTEIEEIIEGLRDAIRWWQIDGKYTREDLIAQEEAEDYEELKREAKEHIDELRSYGLVEGEDF